MAPFVMPGLLAASACENECSAHAERHETWRHVAPPMQAASTSALAGLSLRKPISVRA